MTKTKYTTFFIFMFILFGVFSSEILSESRTKYLKLRELMRVQGFYESLDEQRVVLEKHAIEMGEKINKQFNTELLENSKEFKLAYKNFIEATKPAWTVEDAVLEWQHLYGKHLTEDELDFVLQYYKSPIGQKDVAASMEAMPAWNDFLAKKNSDVLEKATQTYIEKLRSISLTK